MSFGSLPIAFENVAEKCEKHDVALIKSPKFDGTLCPKCELEAINQEHQKEVDTIVQELNRRERLYFIKELSMYDDALANASFENFETPTEIENEKLKWAKVAAFSWLNGEKHNIVLRGKAGTGKSHLAFAMVKALSDKSNKKALFVNVPTLMDRAADSNFAKKNFYIDQLSKVDYLVLDDLGKEMKGNLGKGMIYSILNARSNTLITTNLSDRELMDHYDRDPAILTRIKKGIAKDSVNEMSFDDLTNKRTIYC